MLRKFTVILLLFIFLCTNNVFAHEMYPDYPLRWHDVSYYYLVAHNRCYVACNGDGLDATYWGSYSTTLSNWCNNSNNYVDSYNTLPDYSDVDFYRYDNTWPTAWGTDAAAITFHYDQYGDCFQDFDTFDSTLKVSYCVVYTNPNKNYYVSTNGLAALILGHELGHCVCLGHPPAGTTSIMTQGQTTWSTPQDHDRSDLASFYN